MSPLTLFGRLFCFLKDIFFDLNQWILTTVRAFLSDLNREVWTDQVVIMFNNSEDVRILVHFGQQITFLIEKVKCDVRGAFQADFLGFAANGEFFDCSDRGKGSRFDCALATHTITVSTDGG